MISVRNNLKGKLNTTIVSVYPELENLEVTPTKEQQVFNHENSYGYDKVTVNAIPDEYIIPDGTLDVDANGDVDVTMFSRARVGVYTPPTLQTKEITPTKEVQEITPDENFDGLSKVTVNAIPPEYAIPTGTLEITENGEHDVKNYAKAVTNILYAPNYVGFAGSGLSNLDYEVANIDIRNFTSLYYKFSGNTDIVSLNLSHWDGDKITTTSGMFNGCINLETIIFSSFKGTNVTNTSSMFISCSKLKHIDIRSFDFSNVTTYSSMFFHVPEDCLIIVKDDTQKSWITSKFSTMTNVKTVAELGE